MRIFSPLFICISATAGYLFSLLADKFWIAELVTHWYLHIAALSLFFTAIFLVFRQFVSTIWMLLLTIAFSFPVIEAYQSVETTQGTKIAEIKVLQFNVYYGNEKFVDSIDWILAQEVDIVVLQEIGESRAVELDKLKKHYAWHQIKTHPNRDAFGMAIFSNIPVTNFDYVGIGNGWNNYSVTEFSLHGKKLHMYELHTPPPVSSDFAEQRNINLKAVAEVIAEDTTEHIILVGDMNSTIHSPYLKNLLTKTGMHHAQQNYQITGTWPSTLPEPLRIGIDHLFASKQISIAERIVGEKQNSDHMPVVTKLHLYE